MTIKNYKIEKILGKILTFCVARPVARRAMLLGVILIFDVSIFHYARAQAVIHNPVDVTSINDYVGSVVASLLTILGPVVVLFMVLSGVMFATARGNPEKLSEAKRMLLYTSIGAAIVFGAWLLAELVTDTVGLVVGE